MGPAERTAARRQRLIDAGIELFGTQGFSATGVKELCRQAGVTDRYFYESFEDRRELFTAVFDRITAELFESMVGTLAVAEPRPDSQLRAGIEALVRPLATDPRKARVLFVEAGAIGGDVEAHMRSTLRRFASLVAATARPYLPEETPDQAIQMGALGLVGAIAFVMLEWQRGDIDISVEEAPQQIVALFFAAGSLYGVEPPDDLAGGPG